MTESNIERNLKSFYFTLFLYYSKYKASEFNFQIGKYSLFIGSFVLRTIIVLVTFLVVDLFPNYTQVRFAMVQRFDVLPDQQIYRMGLALQCYY